MNSLKKKKQDILWGKKWRNLIQQKAIKEEMNKQLKASLEKQKQEEEEKECTFKPQTLWNQSFKKTISFVDEFFVKLKPYIEQQQAYLNQLKELERDDELFAQKIKASEEHTREELRSMLAKAVDKDVMESIIEGYKGVRTRGINKVKRERLDILSKMIKLERTYNCFMAKENVDKRDVGECGFDCDLAAKLRNDILKNSLCPNSLRDFARIRLEINQVLEEELHKRENEKGGLAYPTKEDSNAFSRSEEDYTSRYAAFVNSSKGTSQESLPCGSDSREAEGGIVPTGGPYEGGDLDGSFAANLGGDLDGSFTGSLAGPPPPRSVAHGSSSIYADGQMGGSGRSGPQPHGATWEPSPPMGGTIYPMGGTHHPVNSVDPQKRSNKNVYLNSNYTAILKNEDAHRYVSSLQKDLDSVKVIIMSDNAVKRVISGGGVTKGSGGGSFAKSPLKSGAYYGREKLTCMDPNNMNRSVSFGQAQQGGGSVAHHLGGSPERKNTRYVDKNVGSMRNGNHFFHVNGVKDKKEEVAHQREPLFRNNLVHAAQGGVPSVASPVGASAVGASAVGASAVGTSTIGTSAIGASPFDASHLGAPAHRGGDPGRPLLRKIMDKFAVL
ncbi:hypothetical protein, conserved [Plasmodium vivax]|uniref:Uncharacterized protein n=3 Tax=Plasmodium vivax TaxID=5855 RepID=A5K9K4_PLAVS|nr:hypothetical protein, conserved [Plasmodium vivax]EDL44076.1 hypothetical protein, conserved [Plasmodium vivax]KMZ86306.1 hypothetical protein PVBG_01829 [Plasmodium vivax Brazil I]KMZ99213.1 hypothetical protein PVNG_00903 [Plasmodium vivax North Korean]|eukprot:XP_001613803.1 hypothetical protein [Plasmodium vivax Sal-1]